MVADLDRKRTEAARTAVSTFLTEQLDCRIETRDETGIRFFARENRNFGKLHISEEALEDAESPEALIQFVRDELVVEFLREGKSVSIKHDAHGSLDLDVT